MTAVEVLCALMSSHVTVVSLRPPPPGAVVPTVPHSGVRQREMSLQSHAAVHRSIDRWEPGNEALWLDYYFCSLPSLTSFRPLRR